MTGIGTRVAAVLVLAVGAAALWWWQGRERPVAVRVVAVERGEVEATVANTRAGTVRACRRARLALPGGGQVSALHVREGDRVEAGSLLLELWNDDLRAGRLLAQREADAARARRQEACLGAELARREVARVEPLRAKGLVSAERLDQADTEARVRSAACDASRAVEQVAGARVAVAEASLERTRLRAPFAGVVAGLSGEVGEFVTPSPPGIPTPPAVDLIDTGCVYVSAPVDEVDAPAVRVGMPVRVTLDAWRGERHAGTVRRIAPYVLDAERQARTVEVEVEFGDPGLRARLLPGYSADIEVVLEVAADALRIPAEALIDGRRVLVLGDDGRLEEREVRTGLGNWVQVQVLEGLQAGEQVVLSLDRAGVVAGAAAVADAP